MGIEEGTTGAKIKQLQINFEKVNAMNTNKIKSIV
jgi:hypothetical protein